MNRNSDTISIRCWALKFRCSEDPTTSSARMDSPAIKRVAAPLRGGDGSSVWMFCFHLVLQSYVLFHWCSYPIVFSHSSDSFHLAFFGVWEASGNENKSMLSQASGCFFPSTFQEFINFIVECGYLWIASAPSIVIAITPNSQIVTSNSSVTSATLEVSDVVASLNEVSGCPKNIQKSHSQAEKVLNQSFGSSSTVSVVATAPTLLSWRLNEATKSFLGN